jgi:coenzyme PQQ precursor peptide PqqA
MTPDPAIAVDVHFVGNSHTQIGGTMTWVKPKFEIVELCCEVTTYVYHR